ncbi:MAG: segregation/condensation protein A [Anaerolineales bacterium]|nr:segregation/condensation protein A [Anaerolineales bacterium]
MNLKFATNQVHSYEVHTAVYKGPLDLLLDLIESAELDITKLSLAKVTNQYLAHMQSIKVKKPDEVSAFMLIAAKLLEIKSKALLPRPSVEDDEEEDTGDKLAKQLLAYKRYKQIADLLSRRKKHGLHTFIRMPSKRMDRRQVDFGKNSLSDLMNIAQEAILNAHEKDSVNKVVAQPKVTIKEKINLLASFLSKNGQVSFFQFLGKEYSKIDVIVSFLAVLELVKRGLIKVVQSGLFGDIMFYPEEKLAEKRYKLSDEEIDIFY